MPLVSESLKHLDKYCCELVGENGIKFAGIVNANGNLISCGSNSNIPFVIDDRYKTQFMQLILDVKMRCEHDETDGKVDYILASREKHKTVTIPVGNCIMVIITDYDRDMSDIISKIKSNMDFLRSSLESN